MTSGRVKVELKPTPRMTPVRRAEAAHAPARSQGPVIRARPMAVSRAPRAYMNQETHPSSDLYMEEGIQPTQAWGRKNLSIPNQRKTRASPARNAS